MAEVGAAILGATVQVVLEKALSFAANRVGLAFGFSKDLESLQRSIKMIQGVLDDAGDRQRQNDKPVEAWLESLEEVAYEVYEVLDELNYEILRRQVKSKNQISKAKVCSFFFSQDRYSICLCWKMAPQVRDTLSKLKTINEEAKGLGLAERVKDLPPSTTTDAGTTIDRETNSIVPPNVVGRHDDESKIVEMLLSSTHEKVVSVLPIVGMGGLGKTTLAKLVFNHKLIQDHFNKRIWVCVSDKKFDKRRVFKLILEQLGESVGPDTSEDTIVQKIQKQVEGKRYLLVLDDVWDKDPQPWDGFYDSLVGVSTISERNWCLVTSRQQRTAKIMGTHDQYSLEKLSNDDCWSILIEKVTARGEVPQELIAMKDQVIKRCAGLPLAAKVLGSLLGVQKKEEWRLIVEKKLSDVVEDHDNNYAMQVLKLSFDYLPSPSIKKCFAYLSIFEEDAEMDRDDLIRLWLAEGFLQLGLNSQTTMEKIGDKCLTILNQSSLLEEIQYGGRVVYKLHDLVHDLAKSLSKKETIVLRDGVIDSSSRVRYLAINSFEKIQEMNLTNLSTSVRTLFLTSYDSGISDYMLSQFKNLHVLKLCGNNMKELPSSIGKLKHMRYLNISKTSIKTLPESICKLYNLQTLRIYGLLGFPKGMGNLISLRHLDYFPGSPKLQMPINMGRMTCIQTLRLFNIGKGKGYEIEELGSMKNLHGKLWIRNLELVKSKAGAERAKLSEKHNLINLEFCWGREEDGEGIQNHDELVLEGLKPHPNLQEFSIKRFMGEQFPQWFGNLSMLVSLELENCASCVQLPMLGHLPCLGYLRISRLKKLSCIGDSFYGLYDSGSGQGRTATLLAGRKLFPALKSLILRVMQNLMEWKEAEVLDAFPVLENLTIDSCPQLITTPTHFPSLKNLNLWNCPNVTSRFCCGTSLQELCLRECDNLMELPENLCQFQSLRLIEIFRNSRILKIGPSPDLDHHLMIIKSLRRFDIGFCDGLTSIAKETLECCTSLREMWVYDCPNLVSFPLDFQHTPNVSSIRSYNCPKLFPNNNSSNMPRGFGHLTNLQRLRIGPFADDSSVGLFDWCGLISSSSSTLHSLALYGLCDTESLLPNQLQHLTSLTTLRLKDFGLLEELPDWLGSLVSLQTLRLIKCQKLQRLPSRQAMTRLTQLTSLKVSHCPVLEESLRRERGPDSEWSKLPPIVQQHYKA